MSGDNALGNVGQQPQDLSGVNAPGDGGKVPGTDHQAEVAKDTPPLTEKNANPGITL
jgi:hypothetical protein